MSLYNPFKPHLVEFSSGEFAIRIFTWHGFKYYSSNGVSTWKTCKCVNKYCRLKTVEEAEELLASLK